MAIESDFVSKCVIDFIGCSKTEKQSARKRGPKPNLSFAGKAGFLSQEKEALLSCCFRKALFLTKLNNLPASEDAKKLDAVF